MTSSSDSFDRTYAYDTLRIGYFADGIWAHEALKRLLGNRKISVVFICLRYDTQDAVLKKMAYDNGIDVLCHQSINSQDFISQIEKYQVDLLVSMSFNQIFRKTILQLPPMGIINCHAGKLPYYRGRNILNWVLINDEKEFGVTVHYVDEGIDTGDIILQETYPITDKDTYATLLERAYTACADLLYNAIIKLMEGTVNRIAQNTIDPFGMYCGMRGPGDEVINWSQTSRELFNFIRAITLPGPGAISYIGNRAIKIYSSSMVPNACVYKSTPGQVVGKTSDGLYIKTGDTVLKITEYHISGKVNIGDRLKPQKEEPSV